MSENEKIYTGSIDIIVDEWFMKNSETLPLNSEMPWCRLDIQYLCQMKTVTIIIAEYAMVINAGVFDGPCGKG
jgi:hypothetical protein